MRARKRLRCSSDLPAFLGPFHPQEMAVFEPLGFFGPLRALAFGSRRGGVDELINSKREIFCCGVEVIQ
jgi:hypothetical protein